MSLRKGDVTSHHGGRVHGEAVQPGDRGTTASPDAPTATSAVPETPPNPDTYLEQRRQFLRTRFQVRPITQERREIVQDILWAQQDPSVRAQYEGEFVVPWKGRIIAHGDDAPTVLQEAARITGRRVEDLPLVGIMDPVADVPD